MGVIEGTDVLVCAALGVTDGVIVFVPVAVGDAVVEAVGGGVVEAVGDGVAVGEGEGDGVSVAPGKDWMSATRPSRTLLSRRSETVPQLSV